MKYLAFASPFLCFALTLSANAIASVDFSNHGGTLSGSTAGLSLSKSVLIAVSGLNAGDVVTGNLGSISFTTGALLAGSLKMGGTFASGGTFTVSGNGTNGITNAVLFAGTFSGPVSWTLTTLACGTHTYTLTGVVTGMMGGQNVRGVSVQLTVNPVKGFFGGTSFIGGGDTKIVSSVPEPSTLAMFASGTIGLACMIRRKLIAR